MQIIKALKLDKYDNTDRYTQYDGFIYKNTRRDNKNTEIFYCVTLYAELEYDEDTQYPLEDILDEYLVNCTEVMEESEEDGKRIYIFEIESEDIKSIEKIASFVGKRVYNYEKDGFIELKIE